MASVAGYKEQTRNNIVITSGQTNTILFSLEPTVGYAIIVTGKDAPWYKNILPIASGIIDNKANGAYQALRCLGFDADSICYINSGPRDADCDGNNDVDYYTNDYYALQKAITELAPRHVGPSSPLILYMVGHGSDNATFGLEVENPYGTGGKISLTDSILKKWFDESFSNETKIIIIIDACYSGSFITYSKNLGLPSILDPSKKRIILTSSSDKEKSSVLNLGVLFGVGFWGCLQQEKNVLQAFIGASHGIKSQPMFDDNGKAEICDAKSLEQNPPNSIGDEGWLAANTKIGKPDPQLIELLRIKRLMYAGLLSPGEIRVCDSNGRVTGSVNGNIKEEIPDSSYIGDGLIYVEGSGKSVVIFPANDIYSYQVFGTGSGTYGLTIASIERGEINNFTATDIPTTNGAVHQYTIDWNALSQGGQGVTVQIDSNGDGTFEQTTTTGSTFTMPSDVSALVAVTNSNIIFDRRTGQYPMDMTIKNNSQEKLNSPIKLIIQNISPLISVVNADGMDNGNPYFDYSGLVGIDNNLSPGETSYVKRVIFNNPQRLRFTFDARVMAVRSSGNPAAPSAINNSVIPFTITIPGQSVLLQSYPNPFNPEVWIPYELAESADVAISIYDTSGRLVRTLDLGRKEIDIYATRDKSAYWDGRNELGEQVTSGIYFYQIKAGDFVATKKFVMLK